MVQQEVVAAADAPYLYVWLHHICGDRLRAPPLHTDVRDTRLYVRGDAIGQAFTVPLGLGALDPHGVLATNLRVIPHMPVPTQLGLPASTMYSPYFQPHIAAGLHNSYTHATVPVPAAGGAGDGSYYYEGSTAGGIPPQPGSEWPRNDPGATDSFTASLEEDGTTAYTADQTEDTSIITETPASAPQPSGSLFEGEAVTGWGEQRRSTSMDELGVDEERTDIAAAAAAETTAGTDDDPTPVSGDGPEESPYEAALRIIEQQGNPSAALSTAPGSPVDKPKPH